MQALRGRNDSMIFYVIPCLIWLCFCIREALYSPGEFSLLDYVFALPLIAFSVLRGDVGNDTSNYIASAETGLLEPSCPPPQLRNPATFSICCRIVLLTLCLFCHAKEI
jgi:hypothetical protein